MHIFKSVGFRQLANIRKSMQIHKPDVPKKFFFKCLAIFWGKMSLPQTVYFLFQIFDTNWPSLLCNGTVVWYTYIVIFVSVGNLENYLPSDNLAKSSISGWTGCYETKSRYNSYCWRFYHLFSCNFCSQYCNTLHCTVHHTALYCTVLYCWLYSMHCSLYCTALYWSQYCTVLFKAQ